MDQENKLLHACLYISAILLLHTYPNAIAYDRPVHTVTLAFSFAGFLLLSLNKTSPNLLRHRRAQSRIYTAVLLEDHEESGALPETIPEHHDRRTGPGPGVARLMLVTSILALTVRIELFRRILKATECTVSTVEILIPLNAAIYDAMRFQKPQPKVKQEYSDESIYDAGFAYAKHVLCGSRWRYIPSAILLLTGCRLAMGLWSGLNSTYICPTIGGQPRTIAAMQWIAAAIDFFLVVAAYELSLPQVQSGRPGRGRGPVIWSSVLLAASAVWSLVGFIVYFAKPEYRAWLLPFELLFNVTYMLSLLWQVALFSLLLISTAHCTLHLGVLPLSMNLTAIFVMIPSITFLWLSRHPFPPVAFSATILPFVCTFAWKWSWHWVQYVIGFPKRNFVARSVMFLIILIISTYPGWSRNGQVNFHPINMLIYQAKAQHDQYRSHAMESNSLGEAVAQYRTRYERNPPPSFEIWYEYAMNRSSIIIDDYDQIDSDLLPFWTMTPKDLRTVTWEMVSNPWNEISGITVRGGVASVQENVLPTHRWMLEGVAIFMNSFARYLPDMDLAFNLNDESRVAVPYHEITRLRVEGRKADAEAKESWSENRSETWLPIPEEDFRDTVFEGMSFRQTFHAFGSVMCDPASKARSNPHVSSQSHMCLSCAAPHHLGQFISNWTKAADVCHQPDLAHLHGFYLSPAAFKASYLPRPVFSQSKPLGWNDILYPSAWNYMDKAVYAPSEPSGQPGNDDYNAGHPDPDFTDKHNTLFWRGATSEGVSSGDHSWRGMTRQRLVHMTNNLTSSSHDAVTLLLPDPRPDAGGKLKYQVLPSTAIKELGLSTDIRIVDHIARCGGIGLYDCTDQEAEFGVVPPSDFQDHWQYRYLFDLDGAGFSGRFLPFLQSKSLPFKTALFREWYSDRLTAWRHFVPQDLRLHGVWSTLAYFAGVEGSVEGKGYIMGAHVKEGESIAEEGRKWAGQVLRKEDMEIYFFRLCLEWGRLTDDRRDVLGFLPQ